MTANFDTEDSEDLEALFDSIVAANKEAEALAKGEPAVAHMTDYSISARAAPESNSPLPVPRPAEAPARSTPAGAPPLRGDPSAGRVSDEATDMTTSHLTNPAAKKLLAGHPKDVDQAAGYRLANNANQAAYSGVHITGLRSDLSADGERRVPTSQPTVFTVQPSDVIDQIGHMTRTLHDALRELGLNKKIEKAASSIPDARDRLNYVATLTHQAAERVLNATEAAQPLVEKMEVEAHRLSGQWQMMFEKQLDVEEFKDLATQTRAFLQDVPRQTKATHAYLMEIMMAQDFQDLTGQMIEKIIDITENLEQQLLVLLLENAPAKVKADLDTGLLNGPVINPGGRKDVASSQSRVDDLLEGLGF